MHRNLFWITSAVVWNNSVSCQSYWEKVRLCLCLCVLNINSGKGAQALAGGAQGGLESPSLEVSKEQLDVVLRALGWWTKWWWLKGWVLMLEVLSSLSGSGVVVSSQSSWYKQLSSVTSAFPVCLYCDIPSAANYSVWKDQIEIINELHVSGFICKVNILVLSCYRLSHLLPWEFIRAQHSNSVL